ncbi:hypothetical protein KFU94_19600 [Chloroflexi bacterium TSY]|nr:hypothetical protein [Chloroflexi bacterium TSY]
MKFKSPVVSMIIISLIGALAILVASKLLAGHESAQTVTWIIIAIWWVPFSIIAVRANDEQSKDE